MAFKDLVAGRYSVRAYRPDPVPEEVLQQLLEVVRLAPTASNRQAFGVVVIRTAGREVELRRVYHRDWFTQAPLVIAICTMPSAGWSRGFDGKSYSDVDAAIVMDHLVLAAAEAGLGTCWIANFDPTAARELLVLPAGVEPVLFTPLGYPAIAAGPKERKPLSALVHYDRW